MPIGYLLPSSVVIPYSCFAIFFLAIFPRLQRGPTFYSLFSFSRPLNLSPSSGPSIRPYDHAIPRRWSSAHQGLYSFHPFCHPLSAHIHRRNALAYLKRDVHTTRSTTDKRYCATVLTNVHAIRYTDSVSIRLARYWRVAGTYRLTSRVQQMWPGQWIIWI